MVSNNVKLFIGIVIILVLLYYLNRSSSTPISNEGSVSMNTNIYPGQILTDRYIPPKRPPSKVMPDINMDASSYEDFDNDAAQYEDRQTSIDEWDDYFNETNSVIGRSQIRRENDKFSPADETGGEYANYEGPVKLPSHTRGRKEPSTSFDPDMYDATNLLPKEIRSDWFEVIEEPVNLKNRHLISLQNPLGINTIGESLKNANLDLRAAPPCPKMVVGPWNQSTIEPDYNIKPLC